MKIYGLLADILEYPTLGIAEQAQVSISALGSASAQVHKHLSAIKEFCAKNPLGRLEELYTDTFDLQAICCPYVGYHLFGEDRARGMFMVRLRERYRAQNYPVKAELPDHISVMLRFLSTAVRGDETCELISYCLIPAVRKMIPTFKDSENPYQGVLQAVLASLEAERDRL